MQTTSTAVPDLDSDVPPRPPSAPPVDDLDDVHAVGVGIPGPHIRIVTTGRFAGAFEDGPWPGMGQHTLEQIFATELAGEVGTPPFEAGLFPTLTSPGHRQLRGQDGVEGGG